MAQEVRRVVEASAWAEEWRLELGWLYLVLFEQNRLESTWVQVDVVGREGKGG